MRYDVTGGSDHFPLEFTVCIKSDVHIPTSVCVEPAQVKETFIDFKINKSKIFWDKLCKERLYDLSNDVCLEMNNFYI